MESTRIEMDQGYSNSQLGTAGTTVVRYARRYGEQPALFTTTAPCCYGSYRIDAWLWAGTGKHITCRDCGWKWDVYLARYDTRLDVIPRAGEGQRVNANRAEWVSRGFGTRPYHRKDR
jgi:hypothetical protein